MASPPPARPGDRIETISTPALLVDLAALEANIAGMASRMRASNLALRPHAKTHKSVEIARRQLAAGAVGLCCQKVSEAEALLPSGVADILVSNHIVGNGKLSNLAALAGQIRVSTLTADKEHVAQLSEAASAAGVEIGVLIEIDAGDARMGLMDMAQLVPLAKAVEQAPRLTFRGLQVYNGPFQHLRAQADRARASRDAAQRAGTARDRLATAGIACEIITGGGTGSFAEDAEIGAFTEIQPGSYVFMDADYGRNFDAAGEPYRPFRQSLFVLTSVLRRSTPEIVYTDAGVKALNLDCGMPDIFERPDLVMTKASDEQGRIEVRGSGPTPALGERLKLVPSHCDPTVNQYDWMVAMDGDAVAAVWPVDARGCVL